MDSTIRNKLERWIRHQVLVEDEALGRCKRLLVRHVASGKAAQELGTFPIPRKLDAESWFSETTGLIESLIFDDAEGLTGVQSYLVLSYFENRPDKPGSRFTIRESASSEDTDEVESEPPTKTGLLSQMMRHSEAAVRGSLMASGQIINTLRNQCSRQADTIEKLVSEKMAGLEMMERMRSEELERKILMRREENDEKMKGEIFDKVATLVPVVVNKLTGKNLLPAKRTSMELVIQGLIESITQEQMNALTTVLRPEQTVALLEIFQSVQSPAPANGTGKPEEHQ